MHGIGQFSVVIGSPCWCLFLTASGQGKPFMLCASSKTRSAVSGYNPDAEKAKRKNICFFTSVRRRSAPSGIPYNARRCGKIARNLSHPTSRSDVNPLIKSHVAGSAELSCQALLGATNRTNIACYIRSIRPRAV